MAGSNGGQPPDMGAQVRQPKCPTPYTTTITLAGEAENTVLSYRRAGLREKSNGCTAFSNASNQLIPYCSSDYAIAQRWRALARP